MTDERKKELLMAMQQCALDDCETGHKDGDGIVSLALKELGFPELAKEYDKARSEWWYS